MAATANEEAKKLAGNWVCRLMDVAYFDSDGVPTFFDFDDFQNAWQKKRSHLFFDKSLKVQFVWPDNDVAWPHVEKSFEKLQSSCAMYMVTGSIDQNTTVTKQLGGATSTLSTSHLLLSRTLPKGIKCGTKPLTFKTDKIAVYIFPAFVAIERDKQLRVFSLFKTKLTRESKLMVGKAPRDSEVVGQSWKYVNVSGRNKGQPDKRRADNELLDEYKVDAIILHFDKNAETMEFNFSDIPSSQLFHSWLSMYVLALITGEVNSFEAESKTNNSSASASSSEPAYVLITSGIVSSGEDSTKNPTETDIENRVDALISLGDDGSSWVRLHLHPGGNVFIQSAVYREKGITLDYNDGKKFLQAKRCFNKEEIFSIYSAFAKSEFSWKDSIEWETPE